MNTGRQWWTCGWAALAFGLAAWSAAGEVRVEHLPDGRRVVRNHPAPSAPSAAAAPVVAPGAGAPTVAAPTVAAPAAAAPAVAAQRPVPAAGELRRLVADAAAREGVDARLVAAVVRAESAWNPRALSHKGAIGLMQLMPATAAELAVADPWDAGQNVRGGVRYLRGLLDRFDRLEHAVAAYNAGPAAVERHGGVPPYAETRAYVRRVLALYDGRTADLDAGGRGPAPRLVHTADGRRMLTNAPPPAALAAVPQPAAPATARTAASAPAAAGAVPAAVVAVTVAAR